MSDAQSVLMGGSGGTSWSWKGVETGDGFRDKEIVEIGNPVQAKRFGTDELKFWPDNNPVLTVPIKLSFGFEDERTLWVEQSTELQRSIAKATAAAKAKSVEVGGRLTVIKSGTEDVGKGNPKNLFQAEYTRPGAAAANNVLLGGSASPAPSAPAGVDVSQLTPEMLELIKQASGNSQPPF